MRLIPARLRFVVLVAAVAGRAAVGLPQTDNETALILPSAEVPAEWLTAAERTEFRQTPRYEETIAYCRRLAEASDLIRYTTFGVSPEGRDLPLVIAGADGAFSPAAARAAGKQVVLVQNCIHAGECAGKDASLMLLRDIVVTQTQKALLDHVVLLVVPIYNVDGHERFSPYSRINQNGPAEMGWRTTSRNFNLNRDYIKADAVETRAWLRLWNEWKPDLHFDNHTTDGGDWQYDLMYAADTHPAADPKIARWLAQTLDEQVLPALADDGHVTAPYFWLEDSKDPTKGIRSGGFSPRFANGYVSIRNRPSILVETHMLKPYRTQVIAHYNIMRRTLEALNRAPESLSSAVAAADEAASRLGDSYDPAVKLPLAVEPTDESVPFRFKGHGYRRELSEVSGDVRIIYDNSAPLKTDTVWYPGLKVSTAVTPPLAYIVPPQWTEVIELAQVHGLSCERLAEPVELEVESYRFKEVEFAGKPFEGRSRIKATAEPIVERRTYRAGSVLIRLNQPEAKLAMHLFEPEAPDSLVSWGSFNTIFEQKEYAEDYVLEDLARRMLAQDPALREEFEQKVHSDPQFAGNAGARLDFFYRRSPYWDERMNVYPLGRVTTPFTARTEAMSSAVHGRP